MVMVTGDHWTVQNETVLVAGFELRSPLVLGCLSVSLSLQQWDIFLFLGGVGAEDLLYWGDKGTRLG